MHGVSNVWYKNAHTRCTLNSHRLKVIWIKSVQSKIENVHNQYKGKESGMKTATNKKMITRNNDFRKCKRCSNNHIQTHAYAPWHIYNVGWWWIQFFSPSRSVKSDLVCANVHIDIQNYNAHATPWITSLFPIPNRSIVCHVFAFGLYLKVKTPHRLSLPIKPNKNAHFLWLTLHFHLV